MIVKRLLVFIIITSTLHLSGGSNGTDQPALVPDPAQAAASSDWPQLAHDAQRSNATGLQVNPPYCYAWKWYEAPLASRAQPVVAAGRLFIGSLDGIFYARDASTGAPLWQFDASSPIRHSAAVAGELVIFTTHAGDTYALWTSDGTISWRVRTGPSMTAPLVNERGSVYLTSTDGSATALETQTGAVRWRFAAGAPILTTPALSTDGNTVFLASEAIEAIALQAANGRLIWRVPLQGQSLADRYPVVHGNLVTYRSQPLYYFHNLLHEGDEVMDKAGPVDLDWRADWRKVQPQIVNYLREQPSRQTYFTLDVFTGKALGTPPILYTYGNNDTPAAPVIAGEEAYIVYRSRHGIQTDGNSVHVSSKYDAELGLLNLDRGEISSLQQAGPPLFRYEFRLTSDEAASLTLGGRLLLVDNWERLGGFDLENKNLFHVGNVSNDWPECFEQCGIPGPNPFFPLQKRGNSYPFPSPRVTEGRQRPGVVIANGMLYWRVVEGGLAGITHQEAGDCFEPQVWLAGPSTTASSQAQSDLAPVRRTFEWYVNMPAVTASHPSAQLVRRLRAEVKAMLEAASGDHLLPMYIERGFSQPYLWPPTVAGADPGPPAGGYAGFGNLYWLDPAELLYTMASAYPYLDQALQTEVKSYLAAEMERYPPLENLPWNHPERDWLEEGSPRERYAVPVRKEIHVWPPPAVSPAALYAVWLWSTTTGDQNYAQANWERASEVYTVLRSEGISYYADLAGYLGYARLAKSLGKEREYRQAIEDGQQALNSLADFQTFVEHANAIYLDPRDAQTGWSAPVFFGLVPEVGWIVRDSVGSQALAYLHDLEAGDGLRWWYLTRAGVHAEIGESSFLSPQAAWAHFLAHAFIGAASQEQLTTWLDRPWAAGDLYSIQKIVAAIQASPASYPVRINRQGR